MKLKWILRQNNRILSSGETQEQEIHLKAVTEAGAAAVLYAEIDLSFQPEYVFLNGYQSWSWCPVSRPGTKQYGIAQIPKFLERKYAFSSYGDYCFVERDAKSGQFAGESFGYVQKADGSVLFVGSLNEENGYTVIRYDNETNRILISKDYASQSEAGEHRFLDLLLAEGTKADVYDLWHQKLNLPQLQAPVIFGYSSWYNRYQNISEETMRQDLSGCEKVFEKGDLFQVDDGWERAVGDWQPKPDTFSSGMRRLMDDIHSAGFTAGLWLAPFSVQKDSELYRLHPDWVLKNEDGSPWLAGGNWGGFYGLNIDLEEVRDFIRETFRVVFEDWDVDLVKLDFLYAAAPFSNGTQSRAGRMYRAMRLLKECCGDHAILGCGVPLMPAFGVTPYCRIGCDVSLDWDDPLYMHAMHRERNSTWHSVMNTISRFELNDRFFRNDPDVFYLRSDNLRIAADRKRDLARADALLGSVHLISDDPGSYSEEAKAQLKELRHLAAAEVQDVQVLKKGILIHYSLDGKDQAELLFHHDSMLG